MRLARDASWSENTVALVESTVLLRDVTRARDELAKVARSTATVLVGAIERVGLVDDLEAARATFAAR